MSIPANHEAEHLVGGLWLARSKTKTGWRVLPRVEPLRSILADQLARDITEPNPHDLVWHDPNGSSIDLARCNRLWHEALERAGLPQVRLHDARHTTVDLLLLAGVPIELIQELIGHSSWLQTAAYKTRTLTLRHALAM